LLYFLPDFIFFVTQLHRVIKFHQKFASFFLFLDPIKPQRSGNGFAVRWRL